MCVLLRKDEGNIAGGGKKCVFIRKQKQAVEGTEFREGGVW